MTLRASFHTSLADIPADAWDALRPDDNPFVSHAFLHGLERHGCIRPHYGWQPHHLTLHDGDRLVAAAPCYLKGNSHGEFVFDHAWANAAEHAGIAYYPKLLVAVPYSPVAGPRLLAPTPELRAACIDALQHACEQYALSSVHVNFHPGDAGATEPDWLRRYDWQFQWHDHGWRDFDDFLSALTAKKRKNIRQERAQVAAYGVRFRHVDGTTASDADIAAMHRFYALTFEDKGNLPVLSLAFFQHLASALAERFVLVLAERRGATIAGALLLRSHDTLYGRYWGTTDPLPGLHFDTCYYQGIEYCLRHGLSRFEPGAQGEHKLARGFLPTRTHSSHYLRDRALRSAVAGSLVREAAWLERYRDELLIHSPFRAHADLPAGAVR